MNEWMNEFFFQLSGYVKSYWAYNQPWTETFSFMYLLVKPYLPLPFLHHHCHIQMIAFYVLSIILSCQAHFSSWLCHCTWLLFFPVSAFNKHDQSIISVLIQVPDSEDTEPCSLLQQAAPPVDMNQWLVTQPGASPPDHNVTGQHCTRFY